jgi:hypothetical protein
MSRDVAAAGVLAAVRRHRVEAEAAERAKLEDAIAWAALHEVGEDSVVATWGDTPVPITGEGAPLMSEFCIAEFAAALGVRTGAGRQFLADAVELAHRLPRLLGQVRAGRVAVFKARRVAQRTTDLPAAGAGYVDARVAMAASRVSLSQVDLLVDEARVLFDPAEAAEIAKRAAERRHVFVDTWQVSFDGTSRVEAELDLADALDLNDAVSLLAKQIEQTHPDLTRDACRAKALGALARGERPVGADQAAVEPRERNLTLFLHLQTGTEISPVVQLEHGKNLLVLDQLRELAGPATRIVVKPVIDLHDNLSATGYQIPDRIEEHVELRDRHCRFPYCERNARACDTDHTIPYDPTGPPDQTDTRNLAPLCRHHHRLKTHAGWTYHRIEPGTYRWRSPHGQRFLTDPTGTQDLTPPTVVPPG